MNREDLSEHTSERCFLTKGQEDGVFKELKKTDPEFSKHINHWLADNCFGDYYTRTGLDYAQREMISCF